VLQEENNGETSDAKEFTTAENSAEFVTEMAKILIQSGEEKGKRFLEQLKNLGCGDSVLQEILGHLPHEKIRALEQSAEEGTHKCRKSAPLRVEGGERKKGGLMVVKHNCPLLGFPQKSCILVWFFITRIEIFFQAPC
jgi:hypothetical protein